MKDDCHRSSMDLENAYGRLSFLVRVTEAAGHVHPVTFSLFTTEEEHSEARNVWEIIKTFQCDEFRAFNGH